jgi:hypothetical protein
VAVCARAGAEGMVVRSRCVECWGQKRSHPPGVIARAGDRNPGDNLLSPVKDYHRPWLLNGRVRKGNGWDQPGMLTEKAWDVSTR